MYQSFDSQRWTEQVRYEDRRIWLEYIQEEFPVVFGGVEDWILDLKNVALLLRFSAAYNDLFDKR